MVMTLLINATDSRDVRIALLKDNKLDNLEIADSFKESDKSCIYSAYVFRVDPSLNAAFINYGGKNHGFLSGKDISAEYFPEVTPDTNEKLLVTDKLKEGQRILVQIKKEAREEENKGASLTTLLSLNGSFAVLSPNNTRKSGVSKGISERNRAELSKILKELNIPENMSVLLRTMANGHSQEEIQADVDSLVKTWENIKQSFNDSPWPCLLYEDSSIVVNAIRDYVRENLAQIIIDDNDSYKQAVAFVKVAMPEYAEKLFLHQDEEPLFEKYKVEAQIDEALNRTIKLPSGGNIVIDAAVALTAIDVNSAKTKGGSIEKTILTTNMEAVSEIARQLRIRDVGGLIVVDLIDMDDPAHHEMVEESMRSSIRLDKARIQIEPISRIGLMEMSRQRLRASLSDTTTSACPYCNGVGRVRRIESLALSIMRQIEIKAASAAPGSMIYASVSVQVAAFLLNEKRENLAAMEQRTQTDIRINPNVKKLTSEFVIRIQPARRKPVLFAVAVEGEQKELMVREANTPLSKPKQAVVKPVYATMVPEPDSNSLAIAVAKKKGLVKRIIGRLLPSSPTLVQEETPPEVEKPASPSTNGESNNYEKRRPSNNRTDSQRYRERSRRLRPQNNRNRGSGANRQESTLPKKRETATERNTTERYREPNREARSNAATTNTTNVTKVESAVRTFNVTKVESAVRTLPREAVSIKTSASQGRKP